MEATILVTCPDCKKQLKGPAELQGKKVRCKFCGHTFTVTVDAPSKAPAGKSASAKTTVDRSAQAKPAQAQAPAKRSGSSPGPAKSKPGAGAASPSPAQPSSNPAVEQNPYKMGDVVKFSRCPQCASEMDEDAIICLDCGYNLQTRARTETRKTYQTTAGDRTKWLLPGTICAIVAVIAVGVMAFLWIYFWSQRDEQLIFAMQVWGSVISAFTAWFTGRFAFKRLILHPVPPEKPKHR